MDLELLKTYAKLRRRQSELEAQAESVTEEADRLQEEILEMFKSADVQSIRVDGYTVYLHRQTWASAREGQGERLVAVMKQMGMDHFVKESVNRNTLSAYVRELEREEVEIPELIAGCISVARLEKVRIRRG